MPPKTLMMVLIVREAGLRSTLAARLSMAGADIITADRFDDPRLDRLRNPPVLIVDTPAVEEQEDGLAALLGEPRWRSVVAIGEQRESEAAENPRLLRLDRAGAAAAIEANLSQWRAIPA